MKSEMVVMERSNNKFMNLYRECLSEKNRKEMRETQHSRIKGNSALTIGTTCSTAEKHFLRVRPKTSNKLNVNNV